MKKYLVIALLSLASMSLASANAIKLGQKDHNSDPDPCNKPEILGCGPCHKQCLEQNNIEGAKADTTRGGPSNAKSGKASATKQ